MKYSIFNYKKKVIMGKIDILYTIKISYNRQWFPISVYLYDDDMMFLQCLALTLNSAHGYFIGGESFSVF